MFWLRSLCYLFFIQSAISNFTQMSLSEIPTKSFLGILSKISSYLMAILFLKTIQNFIIPSSSTSIELLIIRLQILLQAIRLVLLFNQKHNHMLRSVLSLLSKGIVILWFCDSNTSKILFLSYALVFSITNGAKSLKHFEQTQPWLRILRQTLILVGELMLPLMSILFMNDQIYHNAETIKNSTVRNIRYLQAAYVIVTLTLYLFRGPQRTKNIKQE